MPYSSDLWTLNKIYFILLFQMPMKDDTDGNSVLVLMVPKPDQYFIITINEIYRHEFRVILALKFICLF